MMHPSWILAPEVIPDSALQLPKDRIRKYQGTKEDVYVWKLQPDFSVLQELGLKESDLIVTVRPPATEAHYHNPESELLFARFMKRALAVEDVKIILLPRNRKQSDFLHARWPDWFAKNRIIIPTEALDGLNLMFHSDLVVSGGGTMNREAAAMGVPVFSIFRGPIGAVDRYLATEGRLVLIESLAEVDARIPIVKRRQKSVAESTSKRTLNQVVNTIEEIAESYSSVL
jgi:predicted glycosyltransferase